MATKTATRLSTLNPNAPLFIPAAFVAAEDFSPEWWHLVQTCPAFRDYWLRERFDSMDDGSATPPAVDVDDLDLDEEFFDMEAMNQDLENAVLSADLKQGNDAVCASEKDAVSALAGFGINELRSQQRAWREPLKQHGKIAHKNSRSPRKGGQHFRIQQPRA